MHPEPNAIRLAVPAKINLFLRVGPLAADGFHPLASWMVTVGMFDELRLTSGDSPDAEAGDRGEHADAPAGLVLRCDDRAVPTDGRNLVAKAVSALAAASPAAAERLRERGVTADLMKRIPSGGGLGGGSADAAAALVGLDRLWNLALPLDQLAALGASVGSDVAVFVHALNGPVGGGSYWCEGRGERVSPLPAPAPRAALLILPPLPVSTPAVYRRFDKLARPTPPAPSPSTVAAWSRLPALDLLNLLENDLEPPAFALAPSLATLRDQAERTLGRPVRMSGSGSTLFTLYDGRPEAEAAATMLKSDVPRGGDGPAFRAVAVALGPPPAG